MSGAAVLFEPRWPSNAARVSLTAPRFFMRCACNALELPSSWETA